MKKKLFIAAFGIILAFSAATGALAASSAQSSGGAYPHYHGFKYCTKTDCAPTKPTRPQATAAPTASPEATSKPEVSATPQPTSKPENTVQSSSSLARKMLDMVNEDRAANGLSALSWSNDLAQAAAAHSRDMAENNYFSHTSPTYGSFSVRLKASGISTLGAGENLALYNSLEKAQAALMSSSGHRANILKASYTHCGIGVVYNQSKGAYYITQWFAKIK